MQVKNGRKNNLKQVGESRGFKSGNYSFCFNNESEAQDLTAKLNGFSPETNFIMNSKCPRFKIHKFWFGFFFDPKTKIQINVLCVDDEKGILDLISSNIAVD